MKRAHSAAVARGRRRAAAMVLAGHFSVWAVTAAAVMMEQKERERARLEAVIPFVTARKVQFLRRLFWRWMHVATCD